MKINCYLSWKSVLFSLTICGIPYSIAKDYPNNEIIQLISNEDNYDSSIESIIFYNSQNMTCPSNDTIEYLPNQEDCETYFVCVNGYLLNKSCAPGLHFDPVNRRCDVPSNANCRHWGGFTCTYESGIHFESHPLYCDAYFLCTDDNPTMFTCAPGFYFDPIEQWCDLQANVNCTIEREFECPTSNGLSQHANPNDETCETYFACVNGEPYLSRCLEGLLFNEEAGACDLAEHVTCWGLNHFQCPISDGFEFVSHPNRCDWFILCVDGTPNVFECTAGLHFNQIDGHCDLPQNARCDEEYHLQCPFEDGIQFIPHPENCVDFILCIDGKPNVISCGLGFYFNPMEQRCDLAANVECEHDVEVNVCTGMGTVNLPNPDDCHSFIFCFDNGLTLISCPGNSHFNEKLGECIPGSNPDCIVVDLCPIENGIVSFPFDCSMYVECTNYVPSFQQCPVGTHFNGAECIEEELSECVSLF